MPTLFVAHQKKAKQTAKIRQVMIKKKVMKKVKNTSKKAHTSSKTVDDNLLFSTSEFNTDSEKLHFNGYQYIISNIHYLN